MHVHINLQQFRQVLVLRQLQPWLVSAACQMSMSTRVVYKWLHLPWTSTQTACNSPHDWMLSFTMDLAALCDMCSWKWHQQMLFDCFSVNRIFMYYYITPHHLSPSIPIGVLVVLAIPVIKPSIMVRYSAVYPFNMYSWSIDRLWIATKLWQIACKHLLYIPRYNI